MRLKLIACEILYREVCDAVARSVNRVDVEFLPKGLHDLGQAPMNRRLVEAVEAVDESVYDAVLVGYGLCSNGVAGLGARRVPLVLPRAHDCITLFLGSKERYLDYFHNHPGVYFKTTGWIERGEDLSQFALGATAGSSGSAQESTAGQASRGTQNPGGDGLLVGSYDELVAKYGEDNARFLWEQLGDMTRNYSQITFIETGIEPDDRFAREAREQAQRHGWRFETLRGDLSLLRDLVDGRWDEDRFLVVPPGGRVAASYDSAIVKSDSSTGSQKA